MKIEKLTENKIRIILKKEDFKNEVQNINNSIFPAEDSSSLLVEILDRAQKEVGFDTNGYKLLIEATYENEDACIFTITKYTNSNFPKNNLTKKRHLSLKKQNISPQDYAIYNFTTFDEFCNFCNFINSSKMLHFKNCLKNCILYFYANTYYLIINFRISSSTDDIKLLKNIISEFGTLQKYSKTFEFKMKEHGKIVLRNNAIINAVKYFY